MRLAEKERLSLLSGTALKWIALVLMTVDHFGLIFCGFFPFSVYRLLRCIGRLSFPIFAFSTAEGFRYTKNRKAYVLRLLVLGVLIQLAYFLFAKSLELNIFFTLALSTLFILLYEKALADKRMIVLFVGSVALAFVPCHLLSGFYGFSVSYGLFGALLPLFACIGKEKWQRLLSFGVGCVLLCLSTVTAPLGAWQWFCLLALPILALYNGQAGKHRFKYFFYLYYPLHLVILWGLMLLLSSWR